MRPCGVRSMNPRRSRNGSWTSSIVSISSDRTAAERRDADRPRGELLDDRGEQLAVGRVEALVVDLHHRASPIGAVASSTRPSPWTSAWSRTRLSSRLTMRGVPRPRRAMAWTAAASIVTPRMSAERSDDLGQLVVRVEVEPVGGAEAVTQRGADAARAGRRADDRERLEAEPEASAPTAPCRSSRRARSPPSPG